MTTDKIRLLLVEDEQTLASIICDTLSCNGFEVYVANDGQQGLAKFLVTKFDAIVTDIMMPHSDGYTLVRQIRRIDQSIPILFLSARLSVDDVVLGFELGGNDYLRKPFAINELIVRLKSLVGRQVDARTEQQKVFAIGSYTFDIEHRTLSRNMKTIELSNRESAVLYSLCLHKGDLVQSKGMLLELWGDDSFFNNRSLHVYITKLRYKLSEDKNIKIINHRSIGYRLLAE